jgi:hypothetical protein
MRRCKLTKQIEAAGEKTFAIGFEEFLKNCRARNLSEYTIRSYYTLDYVLRLYCDKEKIYISDIVNHGLFGFLDLHLLIS